MAATWVARTGKESIGIGSLDELRAVLSRTRDAASEEFWLVHPSGPRICMLRNRGRALLMFQAGDDDTGLVARSRGEPPAVGVVEFTLSNGQRDEYPAAWTVSAEEAVAALDYFFATVATTPSLEWRDDETPDERGAEEC